MNLSYIPTHANHSGIESESEKIHIELNRIALLLFEKDDSALQKEFCVAFDKLYEQCVADNYYWQYCPASVYQATFNERMQAWLKIYSEAKRTEFIQLEVDDLDQNLQNLKSKIDGKNYGIHLYSFLNHDKDICCLIVDSMISEVTHQKIYYAIQRKFEFLIGLFLPAESEGEPVGISIDYSDNSSAEKIVFLHELGILDFLRTRQPLGMSTNKLAEIISSFTGINQTTAQSYLNPIYSRKVDTKNTPLTEKNLKLAHEKLVKMGFVNFKTA